MGMFAGRNPESFSKHLQTSSWEDDDHNQYVGLIIWCLWSFNKKKKEKIKKKKEKEKRGKRKGEKEGKKKKREKEEKR
jgi:hypothetical protein